MPTALKSPPVYLSHKFFDPFVETYSGGVKSYYPPPQKKNYSSSEDDVTS